jgi:hypothetical protein
LTQREFAAAELRAAAVTLDDLPALREFRCSLGNDWEQEVEDQIRQHLGQAHLDHSGGEGDPRMILVREKATEQILGVAAHWAEPAKPRVGAVIIDLQITYLEVIAVSLDARQSLVHLEGDGEPLTFGEFVYELALQDIRARPDRQPILFARVDQRNVISLRFCNKVGLDIERPNAGDPKYVQRWGNI